MKIKNTSEISQSRACLLVCGISGIGKTSLVKSLPESETIIISLEAGLLCLSGTKYPVVEIHNRDELNEVCEYLKTEKKYKYVFIDSISELGQMVLSELKKDVKLSDPKNSYLLWGKYSELMSAYLKFFRDLHQNVIFSCLESQEEDGLLKYPVFNIPGASVKDNIKSWLDICLHYKVFEGEDKKKTRKLISSSEDSILSKDRSGKLKPYEEPNLLGIFNKILGETK